MKGGKKVVVISGPSGVGKSTVTKLLVGLLPPNKFIRVVTTTTRERRDYEVEGVHYFFMARSEFENAINAGKMVEFTQIYGNFYGIQKKTIDDIHEQGKIPIAVVDIDGAKSIKRLGYHALLIFLKPPSPKSLETRLIKRGETDMKIVRERVARANEEIAESRNYDYVVVNDDIEQATNEVMDKMVAFAEGE